MGEIVRAYYVPNGSYLMELAEENVDAAQVRAMQSVGRELRETLDIDTVIIASPHWLPKSGFFVECGAIHESFNDYPLRPQPFGRRWFSLTLPGAPALARNLVERGRAAGLPVAPKEYGFDHGHFCPLKVMGLRFPTVPLSTSRRSPEECFRWGQVIRETVRDSDHRAVFIAPGNLTHRLDLRKDDENNAFFEPGAAFDRQVIEYVTAGKAARIHEIDRELWRQAAPEADGRGFYLIAGATGNAPGRLVDYSGAKYSVGDVTFAFDPLAA